MIVNVYSIYDRKALVYNQPFFAPTDGAAVRMLSDVVSDRNSNINRHPADFVLYLVGVYDDQKGALLPLDPLKHVIDAAACVPATSLGELFDREPAKQ